MITPLMLNPNSEDKVLDLCAAPGSKTTQLSEMMKNKGTLVANEPSTTRIKSLVFNLDKMNRLNMGVVKFKGEFLSKLYDNYFDKILVDAPCSGLGIVQKKGEVSNWWNTSQMEKIAELQIRLLIGAIKMAKVGAEIVYSTCTVTLEENEFILDKVLSKYPVEIEEIKLPLKSVPAYTEAGGKKLHPTISKAHRIIPWEADSEGFFVCKLVKTGETEIPSKIDLKSRDIQLVSSNNKSVKKYLNDLSKHYGIDSSLFDEYQYIVKGNDINFIHRNWSDFNLHSFHRIGTRFGNIDKRDFGHFHSHAAQILGAEADKNVVEIESKDEMDVYFDGGILKNKEYDFGQKIIRYKNYYIGTAAAFEDGLKSQFPRAMRMTEILLD